MSPISLLYGLILHGPGPEWTDLLALLLDLSCAELSAGSELSPRK